MSQSAIAIIGNEGSGKSVFVAALAQVLQDARVGQTRLVPKDMATARYCATLVDQLNAGQWPASTPAGVLESLAWDWVEPNGTVHPMAVLDCAGQDFRQIFEGGNALNSHQQKLKDSLHAAQVVILLVNLNEAIEAHGLSQTRRLDIEFAPAMALRALKKSCAVPILLLSQSDLHRDHLEAESITDSNAALLKYLPQLANAADETKTPAAFLSAIETKVAFTNGVAELRPAGIRRTELSAVADIIQSALNSTPERLNAQQDLIIKQKKWDNIEWPITLCGLIFGIIGLFIGLFIGGTIGGIIDHILAASNRAAAELSEWGQICCIICFCIGGFLGIYYGTRYGAGVGQQFKRVIFSPRPE